MDDKIYSRKRLLIPKLKINNNINCKKNNYENKFNNSWDKKFNKKIIKTALIVIIAVCIANRIILNIEPIMNVMCVDMAKSIATKVSNEQASIVMERYKYEDISNVIRDEQGNIKMIQMNIVSVNSITSDIALKIQEGLNNYEGDEFSIKLGTFTGTKILSGRGPNIPIKMATVGNVETELISQFSEAGINQTLHRIYLNVSCKVTVLTPFDSIGENISNQILISEAVIMGNVPDNYYNLNGIKNDNLVDLVK